MTFIELCALCHSCHNYIHYGRMENLVAKGEMRLSKMQDILRHGNSVLARKGLRRSDDDEDECKDVAWTDWRLVFGGREYGPSTQSVEEWCQLYNNPGPVDLT